MFFWKKPERIVLSCYTTRTGIPELFSPQRLIKSMPDWWKQTKSLIDPEIKANGKTRFQSPTKLNKSIKRCYAVQKTFEYGLCVPMWSDAYVGVNASGYPTATVPGGEMPGEHHPVEQYPGMMTNNWVNFKFKSPWLIYTNKPVHFYLSNPFYNIQEHNWQTMPGVVEFFYQHHSNINMIFKRPNGSAGFEYEFRAGDVLAYLIPMFEQDIEVKAETIDQKDYDRLEFGEKIWFSSASGQRRMDIGGCPFHR